MICESQGATAQGHKTEFNEGGVSERAHEPCWLRGRRAHPRSVCEIQVCRKGAQAAIGSGAVDATSKALADTR